jgi:hypothetical protein
MRGRKVVRMGAVLLMLLALLLPVAPAAAQTATDDGQGVQTVSADHLTAFAVDADCGNTLPQGQTRYFLSLVSSTGQNIPSINGGSDTATVTLIGAGTQNSNNQSVIPFQVGDLESQAFPGHDISGSTVENPPGSGQFPNGSCSIPGTSRRCPTMGMPTTMARPRC